MDRLTEGAVQAIAELKKAKVRREQEALIQRLEEQVLQTIQRDRQKGDYVPGDASEQKLAEEIIAAYVDAMPGDEATLPELKELMRRVGIDPRHVMVWAKTRLIEPRHLLPTLHRTTAARTRVRH